MKEKVSKIYDKLSRFESNKGKSKPYPIHKSLKFTSPHVDNLYQWLSKEINLPENSSILDAGCGVGYGTMYLSTTFKSKAIGISLSNNEIDRANAFAEEQNRTNVLFQVQSYDDPFEERFDLIVAIESLKHSFDLKSSITNLHDHLKEDGSLIIIEDLWCGSTITKLEDQLMKDWALKKLYKYEDYLPSNHSCETRRIDLTDLVTQQSSFLKELFYKMLLMIHRNDKASMKSITRGGLALEQLYKKNLMSYEAIICKKSHLQ